MIHERYIKPVNVHPIVARLAEVRLAWGLTIEDVADRTGIKPITLRRYELGSTEYSPSFKTIARWAEVLGYEISLWPKKQGATV